MSVWFKPLQHILELQESEISHMAHKTRSKYSHSPCLNPKVYCIQATLSNIITGNSFPMPTLKVFSL